MPELSSVFCTIFNEKLWFFWIKCSRRGRAPIFAHSAAEVGAFDAPLLRSDIVRKIVNSDIRPSGE